MSRHGSGPAPTITPDYYSSKADLEQLLPLDTKALRLLAAERGIPSDEIDNARDEDDAHKALVALLLAHAEQNAAAVAAVDEVGVESTALQNMSVRELRVYAQELGLDNAAIEKARDEDDPKAELLKLVANYKAHGAESTVASTPKIDDDAQVQDIQSSIIPAEPALLAGSETVEMLPPETSAVTPAPAPAPTPAPAPVPATTIVGTTPSHLQVQGAGTNLCNGAYDRIADISGKPAYASTVDNTKIKLFWMPPSKAWSISGGGKYLPANKYSVALSERFERDQYDWPVSTYFEMPAKPHA